ncbi:MAG: hypothetical protein KAI47_19725 [Deltaproteobacteria bacterium]|nr:hypothetical protein [Deltaproteobacteria bacterium]
MSLPERSLFRLGLLALAAVSLVATTSACNTSNGPVPQNDIGVHGDTGVHGDAGVLPPKKVTTKVYPQNVQKDVDILFMIDNSGSFEQEQTALQKAFPELIAALVNPKLGNKLPNLHIGVVSSDMGAGNYGLPSCEVAGGDGGKLQNTPRLAGCTAPSDAYISSINGQTNIPGCTGDSVQCVKDAFKCIASLGINGCGFESQLESVKRALDPALNLNPGFVRPNATLAVVFVTDEDDCSAQNPQLYDPQQQGLSDPMGPLASFRCFEFGFQCDVNDRNTTGTRKNCVPAFDWLYKVDKYIRFFETLKGSRDRVVMAAIAGPTPTTSPSGIVTVVKDGPNPMLGPSCQGSSGFAVPAIRIMSLVDAFHGSFTSVCDTAKFGAALKTVGDKVTASLAGQCIAGPLALPSGGLACDQSVAACKMPSCETGASCDGATGLCMKGGVSTGHYCGKTCLDKVECHVSEVTDPKTAQEKRVEIPKCPTGLFLDASLAASACGAYCPCWRVVPRPQDCTAALNVSPFAFEIMRKSTPAPNTVAEVMCPAIPVPWSDPRVQGVPMHCAPLAP